METAWPRAFELIWAARLLRLYSAALNLNSSDLIRLTCKSRLISPAPGELTPHSSSTADRRTPSSCRLCKEWGVRSAECGLRIDKTFNPDFELAVEQTHKSAIRKPQAALPLPSISPQRPPFSPH